MSEGKTYNVPAAFAENAHLDEAQYEAMYRRSIEDPEGFWAEAAEGLHWERRWDQVIDDSEAPIYRWFRGGVLNTCYNALDRHADGDRGDQAALIYDSPVTDTIKKFTYTQLRDDVARFAGALAAQGVEKGDRVIVYMPMIPEAVIAMLACARLGAVHSVVFGGFAAKELAVRIDDAKPKVIVSASCGIEVAKVIPYKPLLDGAIEMASSKPEKCIILQRPMETAGMIEGRDIRRALAEEGVAELVVARDLARPHETLDVEASLLEAVQKMTLTGLDDLILIDKNEPTKPLGILEHQEVLHAYDQKLLEIGS